MTVGVETEECVLAYYWNHLHKKKNCKSTSSAVRIIKKREQMLIPNGVDRHFPVFHMNILSFCIKERRGGGIRGKVYRVALIIHAYQRPQLLDSLS